MRVAEGDVVALAQLLGGDADAVDPGAVRRPEVDDDPAVALRPDLRMGAADVRVGEDDRRLGAAADRDRRLAQLDALTGRQEQRPRATASLALAHPTVDLERPG